MGDSHHVLSMSPDLVSSQAPPGLKVDRVAIIIWGYSFSLSPPAAKNARERRLLCVWTNDGAPTEVATKWETNPGEQAKSAGRVFSVQLWWKVTAYVYSSTVYKVQHTVPKLFVLWPLVKVSNWDSLLCFRCLQVTDPPKRHFPSRLLKWFHFNNCSRPRQVKSFSISHTKKVKLCWKAQKLNPNLSQDLRKWEPVN